MPRGRVYEEKAADTDAKLRSTENLDVSASSYLHRKAACLLGGMPRHREAATPEERRKLIGPVAERVYVDMESSRIGAIVAAAGSRRLLEGAMVTAESCAPVLLSEDDAGRL